MNSLKKCKTKWKWGMKNTGINRVVLWVPGICSLSEISFYNSRRIWEEENTKINKWFTRTGSDYLWKMSVVQMTLNLIKWGGAPTVTALYPFTGHWLVRINHNVDKNFWTIYLMNNWMNKNIICNYLRNPATGNWQENS